MIDPFVLLTLLLLLPIIGLLGYVGCDRVLDLNPVGPPPAPVVQVQTVVKSGAAGSKSITASPLTMVTGGELLVATVQWASGSLQQAPPVLTGANFSAVNGAGAFGWNGMLIQMFTAINPANTSNVQVTVTLAGNSNQPWNLCVTAYNNYDPNTPTTTLIQSDPTFVGAQFKTAPIGVGQGDTVYAVAFAADTSGAFPGTGGNPLAPGPGFTAEFPAIQNPLVEDINITGTGTGSTPNPVVAEADTISKQNARGCVVALGIKAAQM